MYKYSLKEIHHILQNINDGVFILDNTDAVLYINHAGERYFGKKRSEVLNRNLWEIFSVNEKSVIYQKIRNAAKEKVVTRLFEFSPALGKWVDGTIYPNEFDTIVIFRDVSGVIENQSKLEEDHRNFSAMINSSSDAMWLIDKDLKIIVANHCFYALVEQATGVRLLDKINLNDFDDRRARWSALYEKGFKGESSDVNDEVLIDGSTRYFRHLVHPVYEKGNIVALNCQSRDITERVLRIRRIEAQNKLLSEIAYNQSHNIRRPIATILGLLGLIDPNDPADPENGEILKSLKMMAMEIDGVIKDCVHQINTIESMEHINF